MGLSPKEETGGAGAPPLATLYGVAGKACKGDVLAPGAGGVFLSAMRLSLNRVRFALRALRHRELKLFFAGQGISLVGTWMQQVAMAWLVYRLTGSALLLGLISFCSQAPAFFMAPIAGALADRWSRYRMVVWAQVVAMLQATAVAALVLTGVAEVWHLVALAVVMGLVNGVDVPARQALLVQLAEGPEDLPNAIALNSSMFNAARLVGPAVGGVLVGWVGEGPVFLLNAVSYLAVLWALAVLEDPRAVPGVRVPVLRSVGQGFRYAWGSPPIQALLVLLFFVSLVGIPYVVLLPVFAGDVLGGDARALGLLTSAAGLGSLAGALTLASRDSVRGLGRVVAGATGLVAAGLVAFALSRNLWLSAALLLVVGYGLLLTTASINTILQTLVDEQMRGRIMSLYTMAFVGAAPVGSLVGGAIAMRVGAPVTVLAGGLGCGLAGLWFARRIPSLRQVVLPIYARKGIVPEVAEGLQSASELRPKG